MVREPEKRLSRESAADWALKESPFEQKGEQAL
jgi:hypothetical protein